MTKTKAEIIEGIEYLHSKINWGESALDAKAIRIMDNIGTRHTSPLDSL